MKILVQDEDGNPVANVEYLLHTDQGDLTGTTDNRGVLYEEGLPEGDFFVKLADGRLLYFDDENDAENDAENEEDGAENEEFFQQEDDDDDLEGGVPGASAVPSSDRA